MSSESPGSLARQGIRPGAGTSGQVSEADLPRWIENRASRAWLPRYGFTEILAYRDVALLLALRDLKLRYRQTFFGVAWAILQPLAGAAIFTVVFARLARVPSDGLPYLIFAYGGFVVWTYLSTSVSAAAEGLVEYRSLVTKVYFPRVLVPLGAVLPGLVDLAVGLVVLAILMVGYGVAPSAAVLLLPVWVAWAVALAFATGLLLSALNVQYRDVRYALTFLIQLWLFASPVVYSSSLFDGLWRYLYAANPAVGVIDGFRWSALGAPAPDATVLVSLGAWILLLGAGLLYFGRVERRFADRI
jgi:lipopolysaccharide transport system permease protein